MTNEEFIKSVSLEGEEWRDVPNYEGFYAASTFGRIISLGRYVRTKSNAKKWKNPILQKPTLGDNGYYSVVLSKYGKRTLKTVHRLVALTFIENPYNKPCVDHIDTNRTNNFVNNLRWCTLSENMQNELTLKRLRTIFKNDTRRKQVRPVVAIKNNVVVKTYPSIVSVEQDGHQKDNVFQVCKHIGGRTQHHGFVWMYLSDYEKSLVNQ